MKIVIISFLLISCLVSAINMQATNFHQAMYSCLYPELFPFKDDCVGSCGWGDGYPRLKCSGKVATGCQCINANGKRQNKNNLIDILLNFE